jgi:hypothetical protein
MQIYFLDKKKSGRIYIKLITTNLRAEGNRIGEKRKSRTATSYIWLFKFKLNKPGARWLRPILLATQKAEIRGTQFKASQGK